MTSFTILLVSCAVSAVAVLRSFGQSSSPAPSKADREAQSLVRDLLAQIPTKSTVITGSLRTTDADSRRGEVKVTFTVQPGTNGWLGIFETTGTNRIGFEKLVVMHGVDQPNRYLYTRVRDLQNPTAAAVTLSGPEAAIPFAGTDFWLSDLGWEFLHWPEQRLVRNAKITMKLGRSCWIMESVNPRPTETDYARVISWIDRESGGLIYAEAFDSQRRLHKVFSLKRFAKNQVKEMGIDNRKADSRTRLEFSFDE